jgi:hypothetical protein
MKHLLTFTFIMLTGFGIFAQENKPKKEFTVELETYVLSIAPGETKELSMKINRSRSYEKSSATFTISSGLPAGIKVDFSQSVTPDQALVKIAADSNAKAGNYMIILSTTLQNKKKGTILRLVISRGTPDSTADNN